MAIVQFESIIDIPCLIICWISIRLDRKEDIGGTTNVKRIRKARLVASTRSAIWLVTSYPE